MPFKKLSRRILSSAAAAFLMSGLCWAYRESLLQAAGNFLIVSGPPEPADLIVVLGGDFWGPRVRTGAALAEAGFAPTVLISGPLYWRGGTPVPEAQLAIEKLTSEGHRPELFEEILIHGVSTIDEIGELASALHRRGTRSILLVTSDYHSRRACVAFFLQAPGIRARCIAAPDPVFRVHRWWEDPSQRLRVRAEWTKLVGTIVLRTPPFLLDGLLQ